ncbi:GNAT family N-acetyltransferase [Pseudomonas putida]|uniref:GNAT family N-acetyltransferase n=1 Tax=Pseudomonas putida TaxID=303 RepID=A0AAW5HMT2_PSEPU|nr:GNAT family N-acetyltransferase [Pseudomonas putida]MCO1623151.1 GNAT family N-acetyltransferase [Pseudomonas putida]
MSIDWLCKHHTALGKAQLYAILQLRTEVFVVEQRHAYQEVDGQDLTGDTFHLMAWHKDKLVAYLRLLDPQSQGGDVVMGRLVTSPQARGLKLEESLLLKGLEAAEHCWPGVPVYLSAQALLQAFYARHGFAVVSGESLVDGIASIGMRKG